MRRSGTQSGPERRAWVTSKGRFATCGQECGQLSRVRVTRMDHRRGRRRPRARERRAAGPLRREAPADAGTRQEDAAGRPGEARPAVGPAARLERARRYAATSLDRGAAGGPGPLGARPRARPSLRGCLARSREATGSPDQGVQPAAARTHRSTVPPPAPELRSELHRPAAPRPPRATSRNTPHAAARATPPPARPRPRPRPLPAGGPAGAGGGLSTGPTNQRPLTGPLHEDWRASGPMGSQ
ncbi:Hypothetical predicted protein [Marmota monax]|uniref:Uncharacterized protein n=1 Tax=Marmota monax TaxID=9995 RepID=A0A5E4CR31_MARMO|nr:hypothetical protein GHT09_008934 [Marmota monax]VTJ84265.1 Hypothetical predicted protein [Marmota monax]